MIIAVHNKMPILPAILLLILLEAGLKYKLWILNLLVARVSAPFFLMLAYRQTNVRGNITVKTEYTSSSTLYCLSYWARFAKFNLWFVTTKEIVNEMYQPKKNEKYCLAKLHLPTNVICICTAAWLGTEFPLASLLPLFFF